MMSTDVPIMLVLDDVIDCVLFGSGGLFAVPAGGKVQIARRPKDDAYRVTIDVCIKPQDQRVAPEGIGARRTIDYEAAYGRVEG